MRRDRRASLAPRLGVTAHPPIIPLTTHRGMAYTSHMPKRDRGKTFLLDHIDPLRWERVKARAKREGRSVRAVVLMLLAEYLRFGLRKD